MGHYVYKYVLDDEIIYIGKSDSDLQKRLYMHGKVRDNISYEFWDEINNADIFYIELPNAVMSDVVESELIRRYKPKCNNDYKKSMDWDGLPFEEPEWIKYEGPTMKNNKADLTQNPLKENQEELSDLADDVLSEMFKNDSDSAEPLCALPFPFRQFITAVHLLWPVG